MRFTFKTTRETGLHAAFHPDHHAVKLRGIEIGYIADEPPYYVYLRVMKSPRDREQDKNPSCPWKWIRYTPPGKSSVKEVKKWFADLTDRIIERLDQKGNPIYTDG